MSETSTTSPLTITVNRYVMSADGTTRIGDPTPILYIYTSVGSLFDMIVDSPGEGVFGYALVVNTNLANVGEG